MQIYGILLLTRKRNFKNVDNTFGTNHSTRKTQSKNFLIFYVLHKIGIFKDAAEQLQISINLSKNLYIYLHVPLSYSQIKKADNI